MVKINEVAKAAGVSISTVSYALSGKRPVSRSTRERIERAVDELGYSPNAGARMLAGRRTQIFALTEPLRTDTHAPTHMSFVLATAIAARRNDYDILLLTDEQARDGMSRVAASGLVDAILVLDVAPDDDRVPLARAIATPTIFIGVPDDSDGLVCVDLDFEAAARMAVDRVADAGHRRIGLVGQTDIAYVKSNFPPRVRSAARARAAERGMHFDFRSSGAVMPDLVEVVRAALELVDQGATALLLHTTAEAHDAVLAAVAERGMSVPGDLSVIAIGASFDTAVSPTPVDTIPLVPQESCDLAVDLAVRSLGAERPTPDLYLVPPTYVSRGTVATLV
ncbi:MULTISPECIES: LacI family DNA-binding transcriptional regulator [unclassified Microbacterium]|uniref:LacI family DNA-binding transcriptional regulator n=1 Tax=unclassified Microbacterium TaxID=2609290 RepID=UPI000D572980|nr:LacI family DNA-binding transcriptional regulator [Microbacterium sp. Gd 4-13]PVW04206.1 LacI family transcriptional regulator [Microbacterium sp. Gd 4-13]